MNIEDTKVGMTVRISCGKCQATYDLCGLNQNMMKEKGTITKIECINPDGGVQLDNGWSWNAADLIPISGTQKIVEKEVKEFFDESKVWV